MHTHTHTHTPPFTHTLHTHASCGTHLAVAGIVLSPSCSTAWTMRAHTSHTKRQAQPRRPAHGAWARDGREAARAAPASRSSRAGRRTVLPPRRGRENEQTWVQRTRTHMRTRTCTRVHTHEGAHTKARAHTRTHAQTHTNTPLRVRVQASKRGAASAYRHAEGASQGAAGSQARPPSCPSESAPGSCPCQCAFAPPFNALMLESPEFFCLKKYLGSAFFTGSCFCTALTAPISKTSLLSPPCFPVVLWRTPAAIPCIRIRAHVCARLASAQRVHPRVRACRRDMQTGMVWCRAMKLETSATAIAGRTRQSRTCSGHRILAARELYFFSRHCASAAREGASRPVRAEGALKARATLCGWAFAGCSFTWRIIHAAVRTRCQLACDVRGASCARRKTVTAQAPGRGRARARAPPWRAARRRLRVESSWQCGRGRARNFGNCFCLCGTVLNCFCVQNGQVLRTSFKYCLCFVLQPSLSQLFPYVFKESPCAGCRRCS